MQEALQDLMKKIQFDESEQQIFLELYGSLEPDDLKLFDWLKDHYFMEHTKKSEGRVNSFTCSVLKSMAKECKVEPHSLEMLFALYCGVFLKDKYKNAGLSEEMFYGIMMDLRCKLTECETVEVIVGTFMFWWFHWLYLMKRFTLGMFQYEKDVFQKDTYQYGAYVLQKGDTVYNFHIPSVGPIP